MAVMSGPPGRVAIGQPIGDRRINAHREQPYHEITITAPSRGVKRGAMPVIPRRLRIDCGASYVQRFSAG